MKKENRKQKDTAKKRERLKRLFTALFTLIIVLCAPMAALAAGNPTADSLWQTIAGLLSTWIPRLGGVVMLVGGIMFGLGFKNDDAEQKSRGIMTIVAGAIVMAIAMLVNTFFGL